MNNKDILFDYEARDKMFEGVKILAKAVKSTLGPKGRNVVIGRNYLPHVTKDGVTVAKEIKLKDNFENIGAQLVREVASKTCNDVGDGTTTATILAEAMIESGLQLIKEGSNPVLLKKGIELAVKDIIDYIKNVSIDIKSDINSIRNIATISANNDSELGKLIADAIDKISIDGVVVVEESKNTETYVEVITGMQFDRGYLAPHFITNEEKSEAVLEDCYVLITDMKIISMADIAKMLEIVYQQGKSLLIVAENYENEILESLKLNKIQGILKVCPIIAPSFGEYRKDVLQDIAIMTGGINISYDLGKNLRDITDASYFGYCDKVVVTKNKTTFIGGTGDKGMVDMRVNQIRKQLEETDSEIVASMCKERIAKLIGGIAAIYVGGTTEVEMKERKDRVDDAVAATYAAIAEGIVVGGGTTYLQAYKELYDDKISELNSLNHTIFQGCELVYDAIISPFHTLLKNAGFESEKISKIYSNIYGSKTQGINVVTEEICNMFESGIVDPSRVTRMALENAASIASLFLTTECVIADETFEYVKTL